MIFFVKKFQHALLLIPIISFIFFSCGGDKQENSQEESSASDEAEVSLFTSESGKVSFKFSDFWTYADPGNTLEVKAAGTNDGTVSVYIDDYSGDLHAQCADLVAYENTYDQFAVRQGVTEVQVDGLPAMHTSVQYLKPDEGEVIESDWIIYNGKEAIVFRSISPADKYDESKIFSAIGALSINDRAEEVSLEPAEKDIKVAAPEFYPEKAITAMEADLSETTVLDPDLIDILPWVWDEFMTEIIKTGINPEDPGEEGQQKMDTLLNNYGIDGWNGLLRAVTVATTNLVLLPVLVEMENNMEGNEVSEGMAKEMASTMITQGNISREDLLLVYENWDKVVELNNVIEKHKE